MSLSENLYREGQLGDEKDKISGLRLYDLPMPVGTFSLLSFAECINALFVANDIY